MLELTIDVFLVSQLSEGVNDNTEQDIQVNNGHQDEEEEIVEESSHVVTELGLVVWVRDDVTDTTARSHSEAQHCQETVHVVTAHGQGAVFNENGGVLHAREVGHRGEDVQDDHSEQTSHQELSNVRGHGPDDVFERIRAANEVEQHETEEDLGHVNTKHSESDIHAQIQQIGVHKQ